jgi:hypothetical protein
MGGRRESVDAHQLKPRYGPGDAPFPIQIVLMGNAQTLARDLSFKVIEDCAQVHGATYKGHPVGSISDIGAFLFCQDKNITTGRRWHDYARLRRDV